MKIAFLFIAPIVLATACSTPEPKEKETPEKKELSKNDDSDSNTQAKTSEDDEVGEDQFVFVEFLEDFQKAVKENNTEAILKMTKFPFETRGEMDSDPVVKYSETQMRKVLPLLLEQEVYLPVTNSRKIEQLTEAQAVLETENVSQEEIETGNVRISSLVFERGGNGWKFTFAYLNAPTRELINKKE